MASFNELMQKFVNEDYDTLVALAKNALGKVLPACQAVDPDHEGMLMLTSIVLAAIGADGTLTAIERKFLKDILGLDDEQVTKLIGMYSSQMVELVDKFADDISSDVKTDTVMLVSAIAACDEKISREETALIRKLLA